MKKTGGEKTVARSAHLLPHERAGKDGNLLPFIPAPDTVRVDIQYTLAGQQAQNTLWFRFRAGSPTVPDLTALGVGINDYWGLAVMPLLSHNLVMVGNVATDWTTETSPAVNTPTSVTGGDTGADLPNNVAVCVTILTAGRGKSSRGRNYVPGIPDSGRTGVNGILDTFGTDLLSAYTGILGSAIDADWEWSVVSFMSGGVDRVTALVQPVIGAALTDLVLDSQRRRLPGRGT
jgi:hypothetical protein